MTMLGTSDQRKADVAMPHDSPCQTRSKAMSANNSKKNYAEIRFEQASKLASQELFSEAGKAFCEAAQLPQGRELWRWKPLGFCPTVFNDSESIERYWAQLNSGLDFALNSPIPMDWRLLARDGFTPPFNLPHLDKCCRDIKEKYSRIFKRAFPFGKPTLKDTLKNHKRIRIGFVVTSGHHLGFLRVNKYLLQYINTNKFDVYFLCPEGILKECKKEVGNDDIAWRPFPSRFDQAVKAIRESQCDILYHWKVGGGTLDYFLAHAKMAPIQCTSYGTHGTSGASDIDYFLTSDILECPETAQEHYTETAVFLNSYATCHERNPIAPASRQELDLPEQGALYFCPHRLAKYHPSFDEYLKRILIEAPSGHIILLTGKHPKLAEAFSERLKNCLGATLHKRIIPIPALRHDKYRRFFSVVTCVLDSPIYAGDLTAHDAFECGVPVVTQSGDLLVQRYTSGMYRMMQMDSLIVKNRDEYVMLAVKLGTDPDYRKEISRQIEERNELVFAPQACVPEYENFFEHAIGTCET